MLFVNEIERKTMENKLTNEITSPIDFVKNPFIDIFSSYEKQIKALNFLSD